MVLMGCCLHLLKQNTGSGTGMGRKVVNYVIIIDHYRFFKLFLCFVFFLLESQKSSTLCGLGGIEASPCRLSPSLQATKNRHPRWRTLDVLITSGLAWWVSTWMSGGLRKIRFRYKFGMEPALMQTWACFIFSQQWDARVQMAEKCTGILKLHPQQIDTWTSEVGPNCEAKLATWLLSLQSYLRYLL